MKISPHPGSTSHLLDYALITFILLLSSSLAQVESPALNPEEGEEIGWAFEAFLSPHQEPGEEENTPAFTPDVFKSTTPSLSRDERVANGHRGHGIIRFTKDLSKAYVDVVIEGTDIETINMFHIHCGRPGLLGPILIDFSLITNIQDNFSDGIFSVELTNEAIVETKNHGEGLVASFTGGCPVPSPIPTKVSTIAGMFDIAQQGELYFNLHTTGQTFFGDMRGQIHEPTE